MSTDILYFYSARIKLKWPLALAIVWLYFNLYIPDEDRSKIETVIPSSNHSRGVGSIADQLFPCGVQDPDALVPFVAPKHIFFSCVLSRALEFDFPHVLLEGIQNPANLSIRICCT
jgi:hypothetical protein